MIKMIVAWGSGRFKPKNIRLAIGSYFIWISELGQTSDQHNYYREKLLEFLVYNLKELYGEHPVLRHKAKCYLSKITPRENSVEIRIKTHKNP